MKSIDRDVELAHEVGKEYERSDQDADEKRVGVAVVRRNLPGDPRHGFGNLLLGEPRLEIHARNPKPKRKSGWYHGVWAIGRGMNGALRIGGIR
jgi:hypothetical protein